MKRVNTEAIRTEDDRQASLGRRGKSGVIRELCDALEKMYGLWDEHMRPGPSHGPAFERTPPYPVCPECGGTVVAAMMTSGSVIVSGIRYYHPKALSVHCCSGACNYDRQLGQLPYPPRPAE